MSLRECPYLSQTDRQDVSVCTQRCRARSLRQPCSHGSCPSLNPTLPKTLHHQPDHPLKSPAHKRHPLTPPTSYNPP
ncbi:hypothetical protein SKAU_G00423030 [Synaphobranchus kaupii]|uniref:Uncharacterized protein n=1 Tax=Synaphobranchus kaupii TaxID=118154 RepID=A0A9Q1E5B9_SYNKA|nr:hypothetical protein SKAU_G00423030 [Synaphobranchus kaupii]